MLAGEYFFDPNYVVVKVNVPVEITIKKEPTIIAHNFVLKAPDAGMDVHQSLSSDPRIIKFTPRRPGNILFTATRNSSFSRVTEKKGWRASLK